MLFVLIMLWSIAATLLFGDRKSGSTRWLGGVAFCGGAGALAVVIGDQLLPAIGGAAGYWPETLKTVRIAASLTSYYGMPFCYLLFALYYRRILPAANYRWLPYALFIPVIFSIWYRPVYSEATPIYFHAVAMWVLPYVVIGTVMVLTRREWSVHSRRIHHITCLAVVPAVLFSTLMNYVLPSVGFYQMWRFNVWAIAFGFAIFVLALFNYGFMGIRVLIHRRQIDSTMRAVTMGTSILNHAVKNDVGKILLFSEQIKSDAERRADAETLADLAVIESSARHIQEMIRRVHRQTQELELRMEEVDAGELVAQLLASNEPAADAVGVTMERRLQGDVDVSPRSEALPHSGVSLWCDRAQLSEAINNVVVNALEAMPRGGRLDVTLVADNKYVEIKIVDTGDGISKKNLMLVTEPFFTTKGGHMHNYGLGLAYSYHITRRHGGMLDITSVEGEGTAVVFRLPRKRQPQQQ